MVTPRLALTDTSVVEADISFRQRGTVFFSTFAGGTFDGNTDIGTISASPRFVLTEPVGGFQNTLVTGFRFQPGDGSYRQTRRSSAVCLRPAVSVSRNGSGVLPGMTSCFLTREPDCPVAIDTIMSSTTSAPSSPASTSFGRAPRDGRTQLQPSREFTSLPWVLSGFPISPLGRSLQLLLQHDRTPRFVHKPSDSYEAGIRHAFSDSAFGLVNYFHVGTEDEIFFNPTGGPFGFGTNENLDGRTRRHGIEVAAGGAVNGRVGQG